MFNPQVGDHCHIVFWTDVEPCTVVHRTNKSCKVQTNKVELVTPPVIEPGGFAGVVAENAEWKILDEFTGIFFTFTLRKNGLWKMVGASATERGSVLQPGHRKFYDYGF